MKANPINPDALYWASANRFELRLSGQCVLDCSHSGECDTDVAYWVPRVKAQVESDDDEQNWHRLIWCMAGSIGDDDERDCSEPVAREEVAA